MSRYGSCETGRTEDSEGTERHLETPISLTGKRVKKEEPKTNNRLCHVFVLGSYWRRWGNAIHVHNTLYSLRWLYYITEILPCQHIFSAHYLHQSLFHMEFAWLVAKDVKAQFFNYWVVVLTASSPSGIIKLPSNEIPALQINFFHNKEKPMICVHRNPTEESFIAWITQCPESFHPLDMKRFYVFANNVNSYKSILWLDKKFFEEQIKLHNPNFCEENIDLFYERLLVCHEYHHSYKTPLLDDGGDYNYEIRVINHKIIKQPIDNIDAYLANRKCTK